MMVTFISQCEKKALNRTRRVLDAFADRIGDNSWQTVITKEGLNAVRKLLRKTASKNTAVSCHWIRSRSRTELVWVVGNRSKFNHEGIVPVNSTTVNRTHRDDRADWHYLPLIQVLTSIAALFHDWGKASARFQQKLNRAFKGKRGDALRHEWVSCLLLKAFIISTGSKTDADWLNALENGIDEEALLAVNLQDLDPLSDLPSAAKLVAWLVLTHHRMPLPNTRGGSLKNEWKDVLGDSLDEVFAHIQQDWGYENRYEDYQQQLETCLQFPQGLLSNSTAWLKELKRWAKKLRDQQDLVKQVMLDGSYRLILHHARLCLMLGDHYYSSLSLEKSGNWQSTVGLIANTQSDGTPKQALDQHLVGVYKHARSNAYKLPVLESEMVGTDNIATLKKRSPPDFAWQDKAVQEVRIWTEQDAENRGFFAVNMASTGCGKTFANAKVMLALSERNDSLRYNLALGLRTLTLQTGDEYRKRIFQKSDGSDLAVLIGSKAILDLHNQKHDEEKERAFEKQGSESQENLLGASDDVHFVGDISEDGLDTVLRSPKDRKFLYAPVLACTIDHIMAATETTRGGRYILPCLRLMSSDLVIDEIDDFTGSDLIAIGRLVHLAGMLGRKVMMSSATIPPALAEGYFNCYREGWLLFCKTRNASQAIGCAWIDEFRTKVQSNSELDTSKANEAYAEAHYAFVEKRVDKLSQQLAKRKANIVDCTSAHAPQTATKDSAEEDQHKQAVYFDIIAREASAKHQFHHATDQKTGLNVSFGVIRVANIQPCVELTQYLLDYTCPNETEIRVMAYHSRQILLLRHEQEKHLDRVLKRKEKPEDQPSAFQDEIIRGHLDGIADKNSATKNLLFIVVATPVEEVGRDHDFDWAIVEPSSYRSIIQLAGRVMRHRAYEPTQPNVALLQYNWKTVLNGDQKRKPFFCWPGYESRVQLHSGKTPCFESHNLNVLLNADGISKRLDAVPRIQEKPEGGAPRFAQLEHAVIADQLKYYQGRGADTLQGYLVRNWWLTALPQAFHRFRQSRPSIHLFRTFDGKGKAYFSQLEEGRYTLTTHGDHVNRSEMHNIRDVALSQDQIQRLWMCRDYRSMIDMQAKKEDASAAVVTRKYGELIIQEPFENQRPPEQAYNDQLGIYKINGNTE